MSNARTSYEARLAALEADIRRDAPYHSEMRTLTTDELGRTVLVGLNHAETLDYFDYLRTKSQGEIDRPDPAVRDCYLSLFDKHEAARSLILCAETEMKTENPSKH